MPGGCPARPESQRKRLALCEIKCTEVSLPPFARQPPGGYATTVATPPPPLTKGEFSQHRILAIYCGSNVRGSLVTLSITEA